MSERKEDCPICELQCEGRHPHEADAERSAVACFAAGYLAGSRAELLDPDCIALFCEPHAKLLAEALGLLATAGMVAGDGAPR